MENAASEWQVITKNQIHAIEIYDLAVASAVPLKIGEETYMSHCDRSGSRSMGAISTLPPADYEEGGEYDSDSSSAERQLQYELKLAANRVRNPSWLPKRVRFAEPEIMPSPLRHAPVPLTTLYGTHFLPESILSKSVPNTCFNPLADPNPQTLLSGLRKPIESSSQVEEDAGSMEFINEREGTCEHIHGDEMVPGFVHNASLDDDIKRSRWNQGGGGGGFLSKEKVGSQDRGLPPPSLSKDFSNALQTVHRPG